MKKYSQRGERMVKKHLSHDQKVTVLRKLGPKPSKLRIQAMAQQYNVSSSTIMNWIDKKLWTTPPLYESKKLESVKFQKQPITIEIDISSEKENAQKKQEEKNHSTNTDCQIEIIL